ncbi:hypothetical protein BP5796_08999 [Coleophoma crateriformis]|uniref:Uncharacterized protein n=1 Tax=Coleophoma crateriformis TaxID=565419 RepID=A0A3D8R2Q6_9HELO|nr:hypothetical protein BP5796_08999 [Coleophoma crateriformis]
MSEATASTLAKCADAAVKSTGRQGPAMLHETTTTQLCEAVPPQDARAYGDPVIDRRGIPLHLQFPSRNANWPGLLSTTALFKLPSRRVPPQLAAVLLGMHVLTSLPVCPPLATCTGWHSYAADDGAGDSPAPGTNRFRPQG